MVLRYVLRHIPRSLAKSLLSLLLAAALIASLGQFITVVRANRALVDEMYDTVEVLATVVSRSGITGTGTPYGAIDLLLDTDFASEYYAESEGPCHWVSDLSADEPVFYDSGTYTICNTTDPERFGRVGEITYAEGYDPSVFTEEKRNLCFVSGAAMGEYGLEYGDRIYLSAADDETRGRLHESAQGGVPFTIIGSFESSENAGMLGDYDILTPFWTMQNAYRGYYLTSFLIGQFPDAGGALVAEFRVRNDLLRDEAAYRDAPNDALAASPNRDISNLELRVLDDEVQNVIKPLDENTDLLELLLPVICAVVLIIGAAVPGLVIIQSSKEASIMRVLGMPKPKVRTILALEQMILCALGLAAGAIALAAAHGFAADMTELLGYAAGYAVLTLIVCAASSVAVTARKPLELLQAKE